MPRRLGIVERAYRGAAETQFADVLYLVRELNRQLGGLDLALRGLAVTYAVDAEPSPPLAVGNRLVPNLPDPRAALRQLMTEGGAVFVEEPDLAALGAGIGKRLLPGVDQLAAGGLALRWTEYEAVWFL